MHGLNDISEAPAAQRATAGRQKALWKGIFRVIPPLFTVSLTPRSEQQAAAASGRRQVTMNAGERGADSAQTQGESDRKRVTETIRQDG